MLTVTREDVVAFRLHNQHLTHRAPADAVLDVSGACGVQNSPPGSALLALAARVQDVSQKRLDEALTKDRELLQTWCMRGAPYVFPTALAAVFTAGVLPPTEGSMRHFLTGLVPTVDELGLTITRTAELVRGEIGEVLTGRRLTINELGVHLAPRIAVMLTPGQRDIWQRASAHGADQTVGEAVVHFVIRILTLQGIVCFAAREGRAAPFALVEEWLGEVPPDADPTAARAGLLRRYLHCYGPSTRADFAAWLGLRVADLEPWWTPVEDEMAPVHYGGTRWLLADDLEALLCSPRPTGARLLPPHDPYTQARDRHTILEPAQHWQVWGPVGDPGVVLVHGRIVGTWRARKAGRTLHMTVSGFAALPTQDRYRIGAEAERVAVLRGALRANVVFAGA